MSATRFGLYELLSPSFLVGFTFPAHIDRYLAVLGVDTLRTAVDERGVVYTGRVSFTGSGGAQPVREHRDPDGRVFQWEDVGLDFRLTVPRDGAQFIRDAAVVVADPPVNDAALRDLLDVFGAVEQTTTTATEYPGVRFRLELQVSALTFHLGTDWLPGQVDADFRVVPRTDLPNNDVKIVLPKVVLVYEQGDDLGVPPRFGLQSWGNGGFDAAHDLAVGELVRMEPAIALHRSGRFGFSVEQIVLDLSPDHTPPEILAFFGTDEAFEGLFVKQLRVFWSDKDKGWAFNFAVRDALISFKGEVSLEASLDILGPKSVLTAETHFFEGTRDVPFTAGSPQGGDEHHLVGGQATVLNTGFVQVHLIGGTPPLTTSVKLDGVEIWDPATRRAPLSPAPNNLRAAGSYALVVHVEDAGQGADKKTFTQEIALTLRAASAPAAEPDGLPADRGNEHLAARPNATLGAVTSTPDPLPAGFGLSHQPAASGTLERLTIAGGDPNLLSVTVDGQPVTLVGREFTVEVAEDQTRTISITSPGSGALTEVFRLQFDIDRPDPTPPVWTNILSSYVADSESPPDRAFSDSAAPSTLTSPTPHGPAALRDWITNRALAGPAAHLKLHGHASLQRTEDAARDLVLSQRRLDVAEAIIREARPAATFDERQAHGQVGADSSASWQVAIVTATVSAGDPPITITATIGRGHAPPAPVPVTPETPPAPGAPPPPANRPPSTFRRLGLRLRLERNIPVLAEIRGELDFETKIEGELRSATANPSGDLALQQQNGASASNSEDGVVDFKLTVIYDTATRFLSETLSLGAAPSDTDGLLRMTNVQANPRNAGNVFKDTFGALLIFTPVIQQLAASVDPSSAGDWVALGVSLGLPVALGVPGWIYTTAVTLYGGELRLRQHVPADEAVEFTDAGVIFDYGVEFGINLPFPPIKSTRPLKVRYKAVGFNLHFPPDEGGPDVIYQPIFDTSKGYTIDLSDPGLLALPAPFGDLLKILGAKIARINPLVLEFDLGLKVDLGVITVDKFKVTWPVEPLGAPRILPTGVKVDVPGTLAGKGSVDFREVAGGWAIKGSLDITVVPVKLRIAASVAVEPIVSGDRKATAVFAGLVVEFPTPIVLGASGLGIFGFSGLFAMHYKRLEDPPNPAEAVGPALKWLVKAKGEPYKLEVDGVQLWGAELDRWSFGVGAILGTLEGGFLANLRGMFVLELPGPRILIFIKMLMMQQLPKLGDGGLTVGILGVLDLNFVANTITIGVIVDLSIKDLIELKLPIELFFDLDDGRKWHLYIGTIQAMASAKILGLVRARGYFMLDGDKIDGFPYGSGTITLPGIAVAVGLEASILLGSEAIGLYLKVAAGAHLGVAFSPFFIVGKAYLRGELRIFIISIEASGEIDVRAPDPTLLDCHVCGKIDLFFFSIEGCVDFHIGSGTHTLTPPALVRNVYLQSHAPVLIAGQGGERPIDASLGDARPLAGPGAVPVVPIDSVPVIQLHAPPQVSGASTFTGPLTPPPNRTADDFVDVGGGRKVRYRIDSLTLSPPVPGAATVPSAWRPELLPGPQGAKTNIDLALMSRVPTTGEHALERSNDLDLQVEQRWDGLCTPVAPPVCTLYAACEQRIGPSGVGWIFRGVAQTDPPGTKRSTPAPTTLRVIEPTPAVDLAFVDLLARSAGRPYRDPAKILGHEPAGAGQKCTSFPKPSKLPNPFTQDSVGFTVYLGGKPGSSAEVALWEGHVGLHIQTQVRIELPGPVDVVHLGLLCLGGPPLVRGFDKDKQLIVELKPDSDLKPGSVELLAKGIVTVVVDAPNDQTLLLEVCHGAQEPKQTQHKCIRALELPQLRRRPHESQLGIKDPKFDEYLAQQSNDRWIEFRTGPGAALLFLALDPRLLKDPGLRVRSLDVAGNVVAEQPIGDLGPEPVTNITDGLPGDWLAFGPWAADVGAVAAFLAEPQFAALTRVIVKVPIKDARLQLFIPDKFDDTSEPPYTPARAIVGVLEVCPDSEAIRYQSELAVAEGELTSVTGYLEGGALVPLLAPGTEYTLTLTYTATSRDEDGVETDHAPVPQAFVFKTDTRPPTRLEGYVYGTTPAHEERFHFFHDPVRLVFNDEAVIQLYQTYGKQLRFVLRGADGVPLPTHEVSDVDAVAAEFATPYREAILAMIEAGLLPCVGSADLGSHASWTSPVPLQPGMNYSFEVELDPADPPGDPTRPVSPLLRRTFSTSRFAGLAELVTATRGRRVVHRALAGPLGFVGSGVIELPDRSIEEALVAAGEEALPPADDTGFTVYWVFRPAKNRYLPHAILIDAAEPLWRVRDEPTLETVPGQTDPAFKRLVPGTRPAARVAEQGGSHVARLVHSPGGTRTVAVLQDSFEPAAAGTTVTLVVERPASAVYEITAATHTLLALTLLPVAPWEEQP